MKQRFPRRIELLVAMNAARERGDLDAFYRLEEEHLRELTGRPGRPTLDALEARLQQLDARAAGAPGPGQGRQPQRREALLDSSTIDRLVDRLERLDARRRESPGQMGLDFTGGGKGPGGGEPCGASWIDPNKTCHKNAGGGQPAPAKKPAAAAKAKAEGPVDTTAPFTPETMERIVAGIEQRSFAPKAARHDGSDLALGLKKLAEAPGLVGEHAREAMAFMDEVGTIVMIGPARDYAPDLTVTGEMPPVWNRSLTPEENMAEMAGYELERLDAATRGRNFANRTGLWSDELLEALKADRSPHGAGMAGMISRARDGQNPDGTPLPNVERFKQAEEALRQAVATHAAAAPGEEQEQALAAAQRAYEEVYRRSFTGGAENELSNVHGAIQGVLGAVGTKGHYQPGGNIYWKASSAGASGSVLYADEIELSNMAPLLARATLASSNDTKVFSYSATPNLNNSESALLTHLHELGHMIHDTSVRNVRQRWNEEGMEIAFKVDSTRKAPPDVKRIQKESRGPTRYSNTNVAETFAESFVGYVVTPQQMQDAHPELYAWVQRSVKRARKTAVASREATNWYLE